jgi:glycosyltransferase involved in cell wall biosynthesis
MISVIIPAYNSEHSIGECLRALKEQQLGEAFEIIVVDDGSTDSTASIVQQAKGVKLVQQKNAGPAKARNAGAEAAKGRIIVFTDSDCAPEKSWLKEMVAPFEDENVAGVQGAYKTRQKELIARFVQLEIEDRYERMKKAKKLDWIGSYAAAYRHGVFVKEKGYDEKFPMASGEDPDLSYSLSEKGYKLVFNQRAIVYHNHPTSLPKYLKTKFFRSYWRVMLYNKHREKIAKDSYTPQNLKLQIAAIGIAFVSLLATPFSQLAPYAFAAAVLLLAIALAPFTIFALRRDFAAGIAAPAIMVLRSFVFVAGLGYAFLKGAWK